MNNDSTAANTEEADNVIFLQGLHGSEPADADTATDSAIFYQMPQSTLEKRCSSEENEAVENQNEYSRRRQVDNDVQQRSRTQLKELYPGAYSSWKNVKQRCRRGNGVLHPEFDRFPDFLRAIGPRPADEYTVDRISPDNPEYGPNNCRWASKALQTANRRNTRFLTASQGTRLSVSEWSRRFRVPGKLILQRIGRGWPVDNAVRPAADGKWSPSKSQDKPRTGSLFPNNPPAYLQTMLDQWTAGLKEHHNCPVFLLEWKHIKTLEYIHEGLLRCGIPPDSVIKCVVENWHRVTGYSDAPRNSKPPYVPDLNYLKSNITAAAMYYLNNGGIRLSDKYPDQYSRPAVPSEFDDQL